MDVGLYIYIDDPTRRYTTRYIDDPTRRYTTRWRKRLNNGLTFVYLGHCWL